MTDKDINDDATPGDTRVDQPPADQQTVRRAAWAGLIGTALEQYDFVIYGTAAALVFNDLFFPDVSPAVGFIASFSTYAVGFAARPVGGLIFSHFGDRLGRKWVLVATLFLMGISTFAIGLLPTYGQVGLLAPILLVVLRILQGLGAGAEQAGGIVLLAETAAKGRRGRLSSLVFVGAAAGTALGAVIWILVQLWPEEAVMSWGWRIVFFSSVVVTIAAFVIRRRMSESPVFKALKTEGVVERQRAPISDVLRHGRLGVARVFFMNLGANAHSLRLPGLPRQLPDQPARCRQGVHPQGAARRRTVRLCFGLRLRHAVRPVRTTPDVPHRNGIPAGLPRACVPAT